MTVFIFLRMHFNSYSKEEILCNSHVFIFTFKICSLRYSSFMMITFPFYSRFCSWGNAHCLARSTTISSHRSLNLSCNFVISSSVNLKRSRNLVNFKSIQNFFRKKKFRIKILGALKIELISAPLKIKRKKKIDQRGLGPLGDALAT